MPQIDRTVYLTSDTAGIGRNEQGNVENPPDTVEIFSNEDERLKFIGEILSNESSRSILKLLISNELPAHEIMQKTNLSLSLVKHHLDKMQKAGVVEISKISQTSRNQDMKHYTAKTGIMILPQAASEKAKTSKTFQDSLRRVMRFSSIGIAGIVSWFLVQATISGPSASTLPPYLSPYDVALQTRFFWPVTVSLTVIIIGLIIERILLSMKK